MAVTVSEFGKTQEGMTISLYTITNKNGMQAKVTDFGAILVSLIVPDANGKMDDVVLGYDKAEDYFGNYSFFGSVIGPNANRIGGAKFTIDGKEYQIEKNDGKNNLHSDFFKGYHKQSWQAETGTDFVRFTLADKDGSMGFPGNKEIHVTYTLTDSNRIELHYHGESDQNTVLNITNHSYFNLDGHNCGNTIEGHTLQLNASRYTPVVKGAIPTGEIATVKGTPMDFTTPEKVGARINDKFEQLKLTGGYDHNWVIDNWDGSIRRFATVKAANSKRGMNVYTNMPGVQFYAGNAISPQTGKENAAYGKRSGLCLETQYYPDTINKPEFPSAVFGPDRVYDATTIYEFFAE